MKIEDDEVLGQFFDTPEKKAKWMKRIVYIYIIWFIFLIIGMSIVLLKFILS